MMSVSSRLPPLSAVVSGGSGAGYDPIVVKVAVAGWIVAGRRRASAT